MWRLGLLYKLCKIGVGKSFYTSIKQQYLTTRSSLKFKDHVTEKFDISRGVKQGDSLSPTLFNIFINDITNNLTEANSSPLELIDSKLGSLLFADDLLLLSETKEGLQNSLNKISTFCENWQLSLNVKKTKKYDFFYKETNI